MHTTNVSQTTAMPPSQGVQHVIFVHIPKAAGSTFRRILRARYGRETMLSFDVRSIEQQLCDLRAMPPDARSKIRLVAGNVPYGVHEYFAEPVVYLSMIRNPVDRLISLYKYALRRPNHYLHKRLATENVGLEEFVLSGITTETDNSQVRFLAGHNEDVPYGQCDAAMLEKAKSNVVRHFAVVGVVDEFDRSLILTSRKLGWGSPPVYNRANVGPAPVGHVSASTIRALERSNALDIELFHWVKERLLSEWAGERNRLEWVHRLFRIRNWAYQAATTGYVWRMAGSVGRRLRRSAPGS